MSADPVEPLPLDDTVDQADDPLYCARCGDRLRGWLYALEYCQGQDWYPVDPVCKPCKDELLAMFGSHYLRWRRCLSSQWPPF